MQTFCQPLQNMDQSDKSWKTMADIASGSFVTLEIEGQVECSASWDTPFHAVCSGSTLHISTNVAGHPSNPCIQKICILRTAYYILRSFKNSTWHYEQPPPNTHTCTQAEAVLTELHVHGEELVFRGKENPGGLFSQRSWNTHTERYYY